MAHGDGSQEVLWDSKLANAVPWFAYRHCSGVTDDTAGQTRFGDPAYAAPCTAPSARDLAEEQGGYRGGVKTARDILGQLLEQAAEPRRSFLCPGCWSEKKVEVTLAVGAVECPACYRIIRYRRWCRIAAGVEGTPLDKEPLEEGYTTAITRVRDPNVHDPRGSVGQLLLQGAPAGSEVTSKAQPAARLVSRAEVASKEQPVAKARPKAKAAASARLAGGMATIHTEWRSINQNLAKGIRHRELWNEDTPRGLEYRLSMQEKGACELINFPGIVAERWNPTGTLDHEPTDPTTLDHDVQVHLRAVLYKAEHFNKNPPTQAMKDEILRILGEKSVIRWKTEKETRQSRAADLAKASAAAGLEVDPTLYLRGRAGAASSTEVASREQPRDDETASSATEEVTYGVRKRPASRGGSRGAEARDRERTPKGQPSQGKGEAKGKGVPKGEKGGKGQWGQSRSGSKGAGGKGAGGWQGSQGGKGGWSSGSWSQGWSGGQWGRR